MSINKDTNQNSLFFKNFNTKLSKFLNLDINTNLTNRPNMEKNESPNQTSNSNINKMNSKPSGNKGTRQNDSSKQQVVSITYEEIGLFPRSFNRVFDRFFKQLFFDVENLVIQEYRFYRYLFLTTVKCVFILLFVPLSINFFAKTYFVRPITEYYWNSHQSEIFLNSYQQKHAFMELQDFEEKLYFESLILSNSGSAKNNVKTDKISLESKEISGKSKQSATTNKNQVERTGSTSLLNLKVSTEPEFFSESVQTRLHDKIVELAVHYNEESIEAITNFFADVISFGSLCYLFFALEIQINITKSFLLEVFFGLDDSKKSLFILFITDLLVGYHSPNIWELFFSSFFDHYGLPESQTTIFLLVATLPVLLDVLFKYLIFRHLNRASPATVATYHAMIE